MACQSHTLLKKLPSRVEEVQSVLGEEVNAGSVKHKGAGLRQAVKCAQSA